MSRNGALYAIGATAALTVLLFVALTAIGFLSNVTWNIALADSGEQGPQGIFDVEIYQCAAALLDRPAGGRWNVETHSIENLPADWYIDTQDCTGSDDLYKSVARVNPALGNYVSLQWSIPYDISASGGVQSDWFATSGMAAIKDKPAVAYGYHTGFYAVTTAVTGLDKQLNFNTNAWHTVTRIVVDGEAYEDATNSTEIALAPVFGRLLANGSHVVITDDSNAGELWRLPDNRR